MTRAVRAAVRERAKNCCEYCRAQAGFSHDPFSAEHIFPVAKGGTDEAENLAWSCLGCNFSKFTATHHIDLVSGEIVRLFHPRTDFWGDHFRWNEDFTMILGKTAIGRATITRLKMNRPGIINLRSVLTASEKHPPK